MIEKIVFGGGCFWCVEAVVKQLRGVVSVTSGYTGGESEVPSYFAVSTGQTGHVEVVEVSFDGGVIKLEDLLAVFFSSHDPTSFDRQGNDVGSQYRSVIFFTSENQEDKIKKYIQKLEAEKIFSNKIVTELKRLKNFFRAEEYHQDYYNQNREQPYCQYIIDPKIVKLRKQFAYLLKQE